jgi:hypothetical protein
MSVRLEKRTVDEELPSHFGCLPMMHAYDLGTQRVLA